MVEPPIEFIPQGLVANQTGYLVYGIGVGVPSGEGLEGLFNLGLAVSPDGLSWTEPDADALSGGIALAATASEDTFLIVGSKAGRAGVWTSNDGLAWLFTEIEVSDEAHMRAIASGHGGFLITGQGGFSADSPAAAWFSSDGVAWSQVAAPNVELLVDVTAYGDGFIAIGSQRDTITYDRTTYSMWYTVDGTQWDPFGSFPDQVCCVPNALAAHDREAVAVGAGDCADDLIGVAWRFDTTASAWERTPHSAAFDGTYLWHVTSTVEGFVSVGTLGTEFNSSRVGIWTSGDGAQWSLRRLMTDAGAWSTLGPVTGPSGLLVLGSRSNVPDFSASPMPSIPTDVFELTGWLLAPGGSAGDGGPNEAPSTSDGCATPRVGTGLRAVDLESDLSISVPLAFHSDEVDGKAVRIGSNPAHTVEVVLIGDPQDVARIEVRGRNTDLEAGAAFSALEWLFMNAPSSTYDAMYEITEGTRQHESAVIGDLAVAANRLTGLWQYEFVVTPAQGGSQ